MNMKKVIYSCITGGYDNIPEHKYVSPDWDYVLFTDNPDLISRGRINHWIIRPLAFAKRDNVRNARWHKINAHILFPEYEYSLWLDGNVSVNNKNVFDIIDKFISENSTVAVPLHPVRKCVYQEADTIINLHIDYPKTVKSEMRFLHTEKYPNNNGLAETNILLRRHNDIAPALDLWWNMVNKYSKRDQLSFDYAMWKNNIKTIPFYDDNGAGTHRNNGDFKFTYIPAHNQDKIKKFSYKELIRKLIDVSSTAPQDSTCTINLLVYTYANKKYYDFAILYPIWVLATNSDVCVEIALENLGAFTQKYSHLIRYYEHTFPRQVKFTQIDRKFLHIPAGTVRFVSKPRTVAKYLYIGDVDIIVLHDICQTHVSNIENNHLDFSNIKRRGQNKLSGLHFIEYRKMYPINLSKIKIKSDIDEHVLYKLMVNKNYKIPNENTHSFRPLCGIHISYFSRPPLKTLTTNDRETSFPCWYDNCNNEKIYDEIDIYNKVRYSNTIMQFYSQIKETDINLRRIIQIIDMFIYYITNHRHLLTYKD